MFKLTDEQKEQLSWIESEMSEQEFIFELEEILGTNEIDDEEVKELAEFFRYKSARVERIMEKYGIPKFE